jgi:hypothetical protein
MKYFNIILLSFFMPIFINCSQNRTIPSAKTVVLVPSYFSLPILETQPIDSQVYETQEIESQVSETQPTAIKEKKELTKTHFLLKNRKIYYKRPNESECHEITYDDICNSLFNTVGVADQKQEPQKFLPYFYCEDIFYAQEITDEEAKLPPQSLS